MSERAQQIEYTQYREEHVDGVLALHAALFPVRYTRALLQSFVAKPDTTALVAVAHGPAGPRVVGFISCRVQTPRSLVEALLGKQQPCLCPLLPCPLFLLQQQQQQQVCTLCVGSATDIMTFGVLPECQRQGIATALLAALRCRLQTRYGSRVPLASRMLLNVQASNAAALAFYRHCGFRTEEYLPEYYHFDTKIPDELRDRFDWSSAAFLLSAPVDPTAPAHSCLGRCWATLVAWLRPLLGTQDSVALDEKDG